MDTPRCQDLAERLHALLLQRLGMGLDTTRMLHEPLYARDVLLVCAAHPGSELARLAWEFRDAAAPAKASPPRPGQAAARRVDPTERQTERQTERREDAEQATVMRVQGNGHDTGSGARPGLSSARQARQADRRSGLHAHGQADARAHHAIDNPSANANAPQADSQADHRTGSASALEADPSAPTRAQRSPLSRFSRLSLSRFSASIFGGSLFEGTLFGSPQADPVTDFGDDSYLEPAPGQAQGRGTQRPGTSPMAPKARKAAPRRSRWFGR